MPSEIWLSHHTHHNHCNIWYYSQFYLLFIYLENKATICIVLQLIFFPQLSHSFSNHLLSDCHVWFPRQRKQKTQRPGGERRHYKCLFTFQHAQKPSLFHPFRVSILLPFTAAAEFMWLVSYLETSGLFPSLSCHEQYGVESLVYKPFVTPLLCSFAECGAARPADGQSSHHACWVSK